MRQTVTITVPAATVVQAKAIAYEELKKKYKNNILVYGLLGCTEKVAPTPATTSKTDNRPANGARKFITIHQVYAVNPADSKDLKPIDAPFPDKGAAMKKAKELAIKHQSVFLIRVEKQLENPEDQICAVITPNVKPGSWELSLDIEVKGA